MLVTAASHILSKANITLSFFFFFFFVKGVILLLSHSLQLGKSFLCPHHNFKLGDSYYCPAYLVV